jgi:hypothetical protein
VAGGGRRELTGSGAFRITSGTIAVAAAAGGGSSDFWTEAFEDGNSAAMSDTMSVPPTAMTSAIAGPFFSVRPLAGRTRKRGSSGDILDPCGSATGSAAAAR